MTHSVETSHPLPSSLRPVSAPLAGLLVLALGGCYGTDMPDEVGETDATGSSGGDDGSTSETPDDEPLPDADSSGDGTPPADDSGDPADVCGDGIVGDDEVCDDGINDGSHGGCQPGCGAWAGYCGDGIVEAPETCESEDNIPEDGCNPTCDASGAPKWSTVFTSPNDGAQLSAVVMGRNENDRVLVHANETGSNLPAHAWHLTFELYNGSLYTENETTPQQPEPLLGGDFLPDGSHATCGTYPSGGLLHHHSVSLGNETHSQQPTAFIDVEIGLDGREVILREHDVIARTHDGFELWTHPFPEAIEFTAAASTTQGRTVVAGWMPVATNGGYMATLNNIGQEVDVEAIAPPTGAELRIEHLAEAPDGDVLVAGSVVYGASNTPHAFLARYDAALQQQWIDIDDASDDAQHYNGLTWLDNGTIVVVGVAYDGPQRARVRKYSGDGEVKWTRDHDTVAAYDAVMPLPDGEVVAAGHFNSAAGGEALYVARLYY